MLTTENTAMLKACPLIKSYCIGSTCMAWRESVYPEERTMKPEDRTPRVGYCGAFGRPE